MPYTRVTAIWSGTAGLPGYSRFKFDGALDATAALAAVNRVKTFFQGIMTLIPAAVTINFQGLASIYDNEGVLTSEIVIAPPSPVVGTATGTFAAPAGACINWTTGLVHAGRKVRGRTFLVPLASSAYESDGTLLNTARTNINDSATSLRGGTPSLVISASSPESGSYVTPITAAVVADRISVLRSRRG